MRKGKDTPCKLAVDFNLPPPPPPPSEDSVPSAKPIGLLLHVSPTDGAASSSTSSTPKSPNPNADRGGRRGGGAYAAVDPSTDPPLARSRPPISPVDSPPWECLPPPPHQRHHRRRLHQGWPPHPPHLLVIPPAVSLLPHRPLPGFGSRQVCPYAPDHRLALLRVTICHYFFSEEARFNEYFIYDAKPSPSLKPLPSPPSSCGEVFPDRRVGLMRRGDGGFFVAALNDNTAYHRVSGKHRLYLYDSTIGGWKIKIMDVDSPAATFTFANKVINIGGRSGSMGNNNNVLRYIPLPPPPPPWVRRCLIKRCPVSARDIVAVNGSINYFEMYPHFSDGWIARTSTLKMDSCNSSSNWQDGWNFKASELRMDNPLHLKLLHDLQGYEAEDRSPLLNLHAGHPALSLQHDDGDVVYILLRAVSMDQKGCLLVIDMRNKTVREVVDCSSARTSGFSDVYLQSRISKHLYRNKPTPAKGLIVESQKQSSNNPLLTSLAHGRKCSQGETSGRSQT
uniref:DUF1618 domain-containing protein n=1 Tax=Oryza punctata TaxID=4537 RepID=A0A0E0LHT5_ORYPU